jgi:cob(I)alamin adenosyltransferase
MANRITKVVTRTGDDGSTGLADGSRRAKSSLRIEAMGDVDELNSCLGLLLSQGCDQELAAPLRDVQNTLFDIGGELALPGAKRLDDGRVQHLEALIARHNQNLPPLREFILPGGNPAAAACHLARAVCRRAERRLFQLAESENLNPCSTTYLNRLSDLLFIMARVLTRRGGDGEIYWRKDN